MLHESQFLGIAQALQPHTPSSNPMHHHHHHANDIFVPNSTTTTVSTTANRLHQSATDLMQQASTNPWSAAANYRQLMTTHHHHSFPNAASALFTPTAVGYGGFSTTTGGTVSNTVVGATNVQRGHHQFPFYSTSTYPKCI